MVDYSVVIRKLHAIRLSKTALLWFLSYLTSIKQFVLVDDKRSSLANVPFGVPQGSILRPFSLIFMRMTCKIACKIAPCG